MTTSVHVETSDKAAAVRIREEDGSYRPDVKVEPHSTGHFHIHGDQKISVREVRDQGVRPSEDSSGASDKPEAA